jgi:tRNA A37 threonylcarbamoyltransferase TsaD
MPPLDLCTDNAAMIAAAAHFTVISNGLQPTGVEPSLGW